MKVNLQSVNFKADRKLLDFVQERMDKLDTYYDNIIGGEVFMKLDNTASRENKIVEVKLNIPGKDYMVKKECKSFEEAADNATEVLRRKLKQHKEKIRA
jgi:putative sigma-54 modulation protein